VAVLTLALALAPTGPGPSANEACEAVYGSELPADHLYYLSAFGCWTDRSGFPQQDPNDACVPSFLREAKTAGFCRPADDGPACERRIRWFVADGSRFGLLSRVEITEPRSGRSVVAIAIGNGPNCKVEVAAGGAILDASIPVNLFLFGSAQGWSDRAVVKVVRAGGDASLGPRTRKARPAAKEAGSSR
jgi:hypothetical protein